VRRIGLLANAPRTPVTDSFWDAFVTRLREHGWAEPRNIVIDRRDVELRREAARTAADELVRAGVEVIVVGSTLIAFAAKEATATIPIVMTVPSNPVAAGLVAWLGPAGT
jgi:putative ABC transport system substrate-binding protein